MNDYHSKRKSEVVRPEKTYELADESGISKMKSVLILEDDVSLALLLKEALQNAGYGVTVVSNGAEGLKQILVNDFSILLCDMVMPNFPGDMFYLAVARVRPHLCKRFIFMTGHHGDRKIEQFIRGIRGLMLWKPFEIPVLFDTIQAVLKKSEQQA